MRRVRDIPGIAAAPSIYASSCQAYQLRQFSSAADERLQSIIGKLLTDIGALMKNDSEQETYKQRLANVQDSKSAEARIAVVKELLPASLRPGGINPLATLHDALSQGIHAESDEECLAIAEATRASLVYLIEQVETARQSANAFQSSIQSIKKKLDQKGKTKTDPK